MTYQSINPYDGKLLQTFDELSAGQLETALATAADCFEAWRHTRFMERASITRKAASLLHEHIEAFARPMTLEMDKLISEARAEVLLSADIFDYYAENAEQFLASIKLYPDSGQAVLESTPLGVLFGVQPWN